MISLSEELRDARLQQVLNRLESGTLILYTEPQPDPPGAAITTQTALISIPLPASLTIVDHSFSLLISPQTIAETGLAAWGRITSASDDFVLDGDCGIVSSTALFRLKTTALESGKTLAVLLARFSE